LPIRGCFVGETSIVQPDDIMPVAGKTIAAKALLQAEDMDGGRFLPQRPLRVHDAGTRFRKFDTINLARRVTVDGYWPARRSTALRIRA
jgi:hypothetical protein